MVSVSAIKQCSHNGIGAGCYPVGRLFALQVRILHTAFALNRALMCGGMGKRYEMSIAKCNTEKVFLRDIMRK